MVRRSRLRVSYDNGITRTAGADRRPSAGAVGLVGPENGSVGVWAWSPDGDRILFSCR